ncbi:MAG: hypothetical protein FJ265_05555 [Planctomycetes bacterium]|nr:hypothetical protein [Planctomycetota bacterium]
MLAPTPPRLLPAIPPYVRLAILGIFLGVVIYVPLAAERAGQPGAAPIPEEPRVVVPVLDPKVLAGAKDDTREHRLLLEVEPLRYLLGEAINVVPAVAAALGTPDEPVAVGEVREDPAKWRGRWLWYRGELEDLTGPREGHPVQGYSIYEATVKLATGDRAFAAFSLPPGPDVRRGGIVRVEGYLLKLRDTTYPSEVRSAPLLVGRQIQRDYEPWPPVRELDPEVFDHLDESCYPGTKAWHTIDEDQEAPLWHLAAYARDTADQRTFEQWRGIGTLNANETYPILQANKLARGTPLRLLGTLVKCTTIAADANPAGIKFWTVAYVQVRDFAGHLIPVWVPKRADHLQPFTTLEVRGLYYRWFAYEGRQGDRFRVPLFVAADLHTFRLDTARTMREVGVLIGCVLLLVILLLWWSQRRAAKESLVHARDMDARRRRRRERLAAARPPATPPAPS